MTEDSHGPGPQPLPETDTTVPHSARIWNYWLGGTVNYPVDRDAGDEYRDVYPQIIDAALASRAFQARVVQFLAGEAAIRQFLDVGAVRRGRQYPRDRAADGPAIAHCLRGPRSFRGRLRAALLTSTPEGATDFVEGDPHQPAGILSAAARTLDFAQPIALLLIGVMGHLDDADAYPIVRQLIGSLPPGSYLALQDGTSSSTSDTFTEAQEGYDDIGAIPYHLRRPEQIAAFFDGLDLIEPGVVPLPLAPRAGPARPSAGSAEFRRGGRGSAPSGRADVARGPDVRPGHERPPGR